MKIKQLPIIKLIHKMKQDDHKRKLAAKIQSNIEWKSNSV